MFDVKVMTNNARGPTPRRTPDELFKGFHEDFPVVTKEVFDKFFNEGGWLIFRAKPPFRADEAQAEVAHCMTLEEARRFVKGHKAKDVATFKWSSIFL